MANRGIMKRASTFVKLFVTKQRENNIIDSTLNIEQAKWFMFDLMEQLDNNDPLIFELINYFFFTSERGTWEDFKWNYDAYLDGWIEYLDAYRYRKALQEETVRKGKDSVES
jgi:hypothetical protein